MAFGFKKKIIDWTIQFHNHPLVMGLGTFTFPEFLVKTILAQHQQATPRGGKKACLTLSFDCDYEADVAAFPAVLNFLKTFQLKAGFACVGNWIERFPAAHLQLLEQGHEIINHTYSHPDNEILNPGRKFKTLPRAEKREEIERCHVICQKYLNYAPIGCRIPHFRNLFTPEIYDLLKDLNYRYSSSTWLTGTPSYGLPFKTTTGIWEFPLTTCPKHPFTVFDTWHSFNSPHWAYRLGHRTTAHYRQLFKQLIDWGIEFGAYINIYLDPLDVPKIENFYTIGEYIAQRTDQIDVLRYQDLIKQFDSDPALAV